MPDESPCGTPHEHAAVLLLAIVQDLLPLLALYVTYLVLAGRGRPPRRLRAPPPPKILTSSASQMARMLRSGQLSASDLLEMHIARIEQVNPQLNALVATRFQEARREARNADRVLRVASGTPDADSLPPFFGVPVVIKECMEVPGMPYTAGMVHRKGIVGQVMAPTIQRVVDAGAIIVGVGNLSEACMWAESENRLYGRTLNPYDMDRIVGGSSGGNGCSVAACFAPFAVTSDVGGSTRLPSFYNGVFGHKPTGATVSNIRTIPKTHGKVNHYCQLGPCVRHPEDLLPLLRLLAGPLTAEEAALEYPPDQAIPRRWLDPRSVDISNLTILDCSEQPGANLPIPRRDAELERGQQRVAEFLRAHGCSVKPVRFSRMTQAFDIWSAMMQHANPIAFADIIGQGKEGGTVNGMAEILRIMLGLELGAHCARPRACGNGKARRGPSGPDGSLATRRRKPQGRAQGGAAWQCCHAFPHPAPSRAAARTVAPAASSWAVWRHGHSQRARVPRHAGPYLWAFCAREPAPRTAARGRPRKRSSDHCASHVLARRGRVSVEPSVMAWKC